MTRQGSGRARGRRRGWRAALVLAAGLAAAGCMESQMLSGEERYGTVTSFSSDIPGGIYPAYIATIDGRNINTTDAIQPTRTGLGGGAAGANRHTIRLPPGDHEIRIVADLTQATGTLSTEINNRRSSTGTIKLYVEEGRRYYLGARLTSSRRGEWEAVVWKVEDDASYDHSIM
jgi:hypothetical protein